MYTPMTHVFYWLIKIEAKYAILAHAYKLDTHLMPRRNKENDMVRNKYKPTGLFITKANEMYNFVTMTSTRVFNAKKYFPV